MCHFPRSAKSWAPSYVAVINNAEHVDARTWRGHADVALRRWGKPLGRWLMGVDTGAFRTRDEQRAVFARAAPAAIDERVLLSVSALRMQVGVTLHCLTLHYTSLHRIALHYIIVLYSVVHCIKLHYITLHYITLHYIALHYITLRYTIFQYSALYYIALNYITLHYVTCSRSRPSGCMSRVGPSRARPGCWRLLSFGGRLSFVGGK